MALGTKDLNPDDPKNSPDPSPDDVQKSPDRPAVEQAATDQSGVDHIDPAAGATAVDVVASPSLRADGTPDQTPGFITVGEDGTPDSAPDDRRSDAGEA